MVFHHRHLNLDVCPGSGVAGVKSLARCYTRMAVGIAEGFQRCVDGRPKLDVQSHRGERRVWRSPAVRDRPHSGEDWRALLSLAVKG